MLNLNIQGLKQVFIQQIPDSSVPAELRLQSLTGKKKKRKKKKKIEQAFSCFTEFLSYEALTIYNVYSHLPEDYQTHLKAFYARLRCNRAEFHVYKVWQQFYNKLSEYEEFEVSIFPLHPCSCRFLLQRRRGRSHLKQYRLSHQASYIFCLFDWVYHSGYYFQALASREDKNQPVDSGHKHQTLKITQEILKKAHLHFFFFQCYVFFVHSIVPSVSAFLSLMPFYTSTASARCTSEQEPTLPRKVQHRIVIIASS